MWPHSFHPFLCPLTKLPSCLFKSSSVNISFNSWDSFSPPVVEPIVKELAQRATPNIDNLSVAQWPASIVEEHITFIMKAEAEALVRREIRESLLCHEMSPSKVVVSSLYYC